VSSDVATALGAAFIASVLTTIGSRWIAGFQAKRTSEEASRQRDHDRELSRLADERSLRDAKRERLRGDYEDLAFAATEIQGATAQLAMLWRGDTEEARDARVNERLEDATKDLSRAALRLRLEGDEDLVARYQAVRSLWWEYTYLLAANDDHQRFGKISDTLTELGARVEAILEQTRTTLDDLSRPR
jgi:hypothetical protein